MTALFSTQLWSVGLRLGEGIGALEKRKLNNDLLELSIEAIGIL